MRARQRRAIQRELRAVFNLGAIGDLTDGQLLERFATRTGEAAELAFAALVERHGPMVLRACRHMLIDEHDAEDALQATFLILVKRARSVWVADSLGPWLHRVASRVAIRARSSAARMREHEQRAGAARAVSSEDRREWEEIVAFLHSEIDRLPDRYRVPIVLCDLEGLTHEKAARHLGWPVGTLKTRLARARELLRGRLSRRGLGTGTKHSVVGSGLALGLPLGAFPVALPGALVQSIVRAAGPVAAGRSLSASLISARVTILIEEVLKTMIMTKVKLASVVVLVGALGAAGAGVLAQQGRGPDSVQGVGQGQAGSPRGGVTEGGSATPAYIRQSRALIITRLEEEVAEARARLERSLRKFQSADHPVVIRAQETLDSLAQRLDRIDRVLVDVVETYPTMVDFSGGPAGGDRGGAGMTDVTTGSGKSGRMSAGWSDDVQAGHLSDGNALIRGADMRNAGQPQAGNSSERPISQQGPADIRNNMGISGSPGRGYRNSDSWENQKPQGGHDVAPSADSQNKPGQQGKGGGNPSADSQNGSNQSGKGGGRPSADSQKNPEQPGSPGRGGRSADRWENTGQPGPQDVKPSIDTQNDAGPQGSKPRSNDGDSQNDVRQQGSKPGANKRDWQHDKANPGGDGQTKGDTPR